MARRPITLRVQGGYEPGDPVQCANLDCNVYMEPPFHGYELTANAYMSRVLLCCKCAAKINAAGSVNLEVDFGGANITGESNGDLV